MRKLAIVLLTGCSFGIVSAGYASDLPARMPTKAPVAVYAPLPFTWTGFYAGGNAGWGWTNGSGTVTSGGASGPISVSGNGFLGGVQAGYNWQMNSIVFGLETDFQGGSGSGTVTSTVGGITNTGTAKAPWFGTIRGRLGYAAADTWLLYMTGGAVYGKSTLDGTIPVTGAFSSSATYWTWTAGAGVEKMLWNRWSAKLEYLYIGTPNHAPTPPGTTLSGSAHANIVRVGLNYHF